MALASESPNNQAQCYGVRLAVAPENSLAAAQLLNDTFTLAEGDLMSTMQAPTAKSPAIQQSANRDMSTLQKVMALLPKGPNKPQASWRKEGRRSSRGESCGRQVGELSSRSSGG